MDTEPKITTHSKMGER
jgi:hypothetical protein